MTHQGGADVVEADEDSLDDDAFHVLQPEPPLTRKGPQVQAVGIDSGNQERPHQLA